MTAHSLTLADFLLARLDEDRAGWGPRSVVEMHTPNERGVCVCCEGAEALGEGSDPETHVCDVLLILAKPYNEHPECREEWRS